ncbi:MAG: protein kinase [Candidatus Sericytochromatia bacterium]|nr:protein kinase [Candidatus Sericytochromatia bacterium]
MIGELLVNRYRVLRQLGEGAMGEVWLVEDTTHSLEVALKVIARRGATASIDEEQLEKSYLDFEQEFRLMTQLRHRNCCEVLDYGLLPGGQPYITMEYVPGVGLDELGRVDAATFQSLFSQIAAALEYIHARGLVHSDLKSANVRVRPDGTLKVMDYGLMEYAGRVGGAIRGTLGYLAPEVFRRGLIDRRTDLYALGVLGFEMLTGRLPFEAEKPGDVVRAHVETAPPRMAEFVTGIEPHHERIVRRLLAKEPLERFQSAEEILIALGLAEDRGLTGRLLASPLVGRASEMARLFVCLARVTGGRPGAALVIRGPAGSGKSRLLKEFSFNARLENLPYSESHNLEFAQAPYASLIIILRGLMPYFREFVPDELVASAPVLAKILPELSGEVARELEAGDQKKRLQATIVGLIHALASRRGTVLLVEDLQWVDALTQEVLTALISITTEMPLLLLLTTRGERDQWLKEDVVRAIDLPLLPRAGIERMVASMLGVTELEAAIADLVVQTAAGNPGYVEIFLEHLVETHALRRSQGTWMLVADSFAEREQWAVSGLLARKFSALPGSAQALARIAAVWGGEFTLETLRDLAETSDDAFFAAMETLRANQIFIPVDAGRWNIPADSLRNAIFETLHPTDRRLLHTRVGQYLVRHAPGHTLDGLSMGLLVAATRHFCQGELPYEAVRTSLELGSRLAALSALQEAAVHLEAGLTLLRDNEPGSPLEAEFLRLLGHVYQQAGEFERARFTYSELIPRLEILGDRFLLGRVLIASSAVEQALDNLEDALLLAERAHRVALDASDFAGAARARLLAGKAAGSMGRTGDSLRWLKEALDLSDLSDEVALVAECLAEHGFAQAAWLPENIEQGLDALGRALDQVSQVDDTRGKMRVLTLLGQTQLAAGEYAGARTQLAAAQKLASQLGDALELCVMQTLLALCDLESGAFDAAADSARLNVEAAGRLGSSYLLGIGLMTEVVSEVWRGNLKEASALMGVAFEQAGGTRNTWGEARMLALKGDALSLMGRNAESLQTAERLQELMVDTGNLEPQGRLCLLWGENLLRSGALDEAAQFFKQALEIAQSSRSLYVQLQALLGCARLALEREIWDDASNAIEKALSLAQTMGVSYAEALAWGLKGEYGLAVQDGSPGEAFVRMRELASHHHLPLLEARALFGMAASNPYDENARGMAGAAREIIERLVDGLSLHHAEAYLALPQIQQMREGNFVAFGLRRRMIRKFSAPKIDPHSWLR